MLKSSMFNLWKRCAEDFDRKPDRIGYEFLSKRDSCGRIIPANDSMQMCVTDWIVHASFANLNPLGSRDVDFDKKLKLLIKLLKVNGQFENLHFNPIVWSP